MKPDRAWIKLHLLEAVNCIYDCTNSLLLEEKARHAFDESLGMRLPISFCRALLSRTRGPKT